MFYGITKENEKVAINESSNDSVYYCPLCKSPLIRKLGNINTHHFAHQKGMSCDPWYNDMSPWHRKWQSIFPVANQEVVITRSNEGHIADVEINDTVIEFQHSTITNEELVLRNDFYKKCGKRIIWVVDCYGKELYFRNTRTLQCIRSNTTIEETLSQKFEWKHRKRVFDDLNLNYDVQLFLHVNDEIIIKVIDRVKGYWGLSVFNGIALKIRDFIDYISSNMNFPITYQNEFQGYVDFFYRDYNARNLKKWINECYRKEDKRFKIDDETLELLDAYSRGEVDETVLKENKYVSGYCMPTSNNYYFSK